MLIEELDEEKVRGISAFVFFWLRDAKPTAGLEVEKGHWTEEIANDARRHKKILQIVTTATLMQGVEYDYPLGDQRRRGARPRFR